MVWGNVKRCGLPLVLNCNPKIGWGVFGIILYCQLGNGKSTTGMTFEHINARARQIKRPQVALEAYIFRDV